jgi:hypothetical protein
LIQKIRAEAIRQGVDPALALAVVQSESGFRPSVRGDDGNSQGLFQLRPAAAIDAGIDPAKRLDPDTNIYGGIRYLKMQLDKEHGNERRALTRYNTGTPTYRGIGTPGYAEHVLQQKAGFARYEPATPQPGGLTRASRGLSPARAEAAPVSPARQTGATPQGTSAFNELFGQAPGLGPAAPAPAAQAPAAPAPAAQAPAAQAPAAPATPHQSTMSPPSGAAPLPRSPALAAEQAQAQQQPWWQRAATAFGAASPEIATYASDLPQIEQAKTEMSPAERAELQRREGATQGGELSNVGEIVGQVGGSLLLPGLGTAVGGTVGSVAGMTADTVLREGRLPNWKEVATEAAWSAVPEVAESTVRGVARMIGRGTRGGQLIRFDEAARRARDQLPQVFQAQTRQQVGAEFDAVRASGLQLDVQPVRQELQRLTPGNYDQVLEEIRGLDNRHGTGTTYQQIVDSLRQPGQAVRGVQIGTLQDLRSALRQRIERLPTHGARQQLQDVQDAVDAAIDAGIARGSVATGMTVQQLQEARRQWGRVRAAEDLGVLVERSIRGTGDLSMGTLNLRQMADYLRRNEGDLAQRINRALDHTPGARAAFQREMDDIAQLYRTVELPMSDVMGIWRMPGFAALRQIISNTLISPRGREMFRNAIVNGRGNLSLNNMAIAANMARRETGLALPDLPGLEQEEGKLKEGRQIEVAPGRLSR